jgi:hypothetical protein
MSWEGSSKSSQGSNGEGGRPWAGSPQRARELEHSRRAEQRSPNTGDQYRNLYQCGLWVAGLWGPYQKVAPYFEVG